MKRVAILTTHRANNFGAMLQAFSLVKMCNELGSDTEILDWRCPYYERMYHTVFKWGNGVRSLWCCVWRLVVERRCKNMFAVFRDRLKISRPVFARAELEKMENEYDAFITGSDQVWNPINSAPQSNPTMFDRAYLLDFVKTKSKNSYAASIGVSEIKPATLIPEFVEAWRTYGIITLREHAGSEYVTRLSEHPAMTVFDPVLLHSDNWWKQNCSKSVLLPPRYIFEYNVNRLGLLDNVACSLSKRLKCRIVKPIIPGQATFKNVFGVSMGPEEFVMAIQTAECVFTSSFHCTAFSLIFRKKLYLAQRLRSDRPNTRFDSLFKFAGVKPIVVEQKGDIVVLFVDFTQVDEGMIESERKKSIEVLKAIVI